MYKFTAISIRTPLDCFVEIDKLFVKSIWNSNVPRVAKTGCTLSDFTTFNTNQQWPRVWY